MLLRSSSTPVLGSLLSSFSDSPNNSHHHETYATLKHHHTFHHQRLNRFPYHQTGCLNLATASCNSSPISPSIADFSEYSYKGLRRVQSDGNLEGLAHASCNNNEEYYNSSRPKKLSGKSKCLMLETIPSFSFCNLRGRYEDDEEECNDMLEEEDGERWEENVKAEGEDFGLSNGKMENMVLTEETRVVDGFWNLSSEEEIGSIREEMYLAKGLGIDGGVNGNCGVNGNGGGSGGGGGGEFNSAGGDGGDIQGTEEHYKKMVQESPGNPLFLRNYAQFLYQTKQDLQGAEEYYSRAILADPNDGEILSQYAKLVWELHHDQNRASSYFERAVQASPEDSHVHAAYACFLWETEEGDDECNVQKDFTAMPPHFHEGARASAGP